MFNNELWQKPAGGAGGAGFYSHQIANSCRFNRANVSKMSRALGTPSDTKKFTFSSWVKLSSLSTATNDKRCIFGGSGSTYSLSLGIENGQLIYIDYPTSGGSNTGGIETLVYLKRQSRDTSAWQHIVINNDTTQAVAANRVKFYINGELQTVFDTHSAGGAPTPFYPAEDSVTINASSHTFIIGTSNNDDVANSWDGYQAETYFIDGTAYAGSDFGETKNGVWIPKDASGLTFGNNGFYLKYTNSSALGEDFSGNDNDYTVSNISAHDQMLDTPTFNSDSNGGNFCTFNPLNKGSYSVLSEGNLVAGSNTSADGTYPSGNMAFKTGKWYWEHLVGSSFNDNYPSSTFIDISAPQSHATTNGLTWAIRYYGGGGTIVAESGNAVANMGTITIVNTGVATYGANDLISWYIDIDNKKAWIAKNGTIPNSGDPANGTNPQVTWTGNPIITHGGMLRVGYTLTLNAGQDGTFAGAKTAQGNSDDTGYGNFYYAPPTGFLAMCAGNLPTADAIDPAQTDDNYPQKLFNTKLYTGTGSSNALTGLGFKPDWTWIKERGGANDHKLTDSTRGVTKAIESNTQVAQTTDSNGLTAFGTDGFTVGSDAVYNNSSDTYVGWNWRANGGTTASNGNGNIASVTQVDPSGGFSIVTYTGSGTAGNTVGHGLSTTPDTIMIKNITSVDSWALYFSALGNTIHLALDSTAAQVTSSAYWNSTSPTSTVFTVGTGDALNQSTKNYVAYCFANTEGYIKSGTYVGNGNDDGTFVYTGFRPAMMIIKELVVDDWLIYDDKRIGQNNDSGSGNAVLYPNGSYAEENQASRAIDILSNGFKLRTSNATGNASGGNYIYLAFAKNPFKYATAR